MARKYRCDIVADNWEHIRDVDTNDVIMAMEVYIDPPGRRKFVGYLFAWESTRNPNGGHEVCVKYNEDDNTWYVYDSNKHGPYPLRQFQVADKDTWQIYAVFKK